jgi:hypothetical protein
MAAPAIPPNPSTAATNDQECDNEIQHRSLADFGRVPDGSIVRQPNNNEG